MRQLKEREVVIKCDINNCGLKYDHYCITYKNLKGSHVSCLKATEFKIHLGNKWLTVNWKHGRKERILAVPRENVFDIILITS